MKWFYLIFASFLCWGCASKQHNAPAAFTTNVSVLYSENVQDSFEIYISRPANFSAGKIYHAVYYFDANLKSGKKLREMLRSGKYAHTTANSIFIGIGHIGNYRVLRRRDLMPAVLFPGDTAFVSRNYGHAEKFYQFLQAELLPYISTNYHVDQSQNTVIGHSFGGLFVFYCLFKNDSMFRNYYALSPSLWVEDYNVYRYNQLDKGLVGAKKIYFSCGGLEVVNFIKKGTDEMKAFLDEKSYPALEYKYQVHAGESHNSQVEKSFEYLLSSL